MPAQAQGRSEVGAGAGPGTGGGGGVSPGVALGQLLAGNQRYLAGAGRRRDYGAVRGVLATGQHPFAVVFGCSDSRATPEIIFDQGLGDIFTARNAGVIVTTQMLGTFEYAVSVLKTPLILVLGHSNCGAVAAATAAVQSGKKYPGHIAAVAQALAPPVRQALAQFSRDATHRAIAEQAVTQVAVQRAVVEECVRTSARSLITRSPILAAAVRSGQLGIAGAVYHVASGDVSLVE